MTFDAKLLPIILLVFAIGGWVAWAESSHGDTRSNKEVLGQLLKLKEREALQVEADREALRKLCLAGKLTGNECVKVGLPPTQETQP